MPQILFMTVYLNEIKMRMINVTKKSILILWVIVYFVVYITQLLFTQNYAQREAHHTEKSIPSQVNEQQVSEELEVSNTFKNDIETRNVVLKEACKHYGLDVLGNDRLHKPYPWEYLIAKQKSANLVWCNVFKSGSTSWMYIFNRMAGYTVLDLEHTKTPQVTLARKKYPRPSSTELLSILAYPNTIGFLIARNPYERLVSGYRDKILGAKPSSAHDIMCRNIMVRYRGMDPKKYRAKVTTPPTFTEFVRYILDEEKSGYEVDMHWAPVYSFCNPCQVNLTHIIKMETFQRDTNQILERANLSQYLPVRAKQRQNASKGKHNSSVDVTLYLDELPSDLRKALNDFYQIDFDLFGYLPG